MQLKAIAKYLLLCLAASLAIESSPGADIKDVCIRHETRDTVKPNCKKIKGKHDAFPVYKCTDEQRKVKEYRTGGPWEEIDPRDPRCLPEPKKRDAMRGEGEKKKDKGGKK